MHGRLLRMPAVKDCERFLLHYLRSRLAVCNEAAQASVPRTAVLGSQVDLAETAGVGPPYLSPHEIKRVPVTSTPEKRKKEMPVL